MACEKVLADTAFHRKCGYQTSGRRYWIPSKKSYTFSQSHFTPCKSYYAGRR